VHAARATRRLPRRQVETLATTAARQGALQAPQTLILALSAQLGSGLLLLLVLLIFTARNRVSKRHVTSSRATHGGAGGGEARGSASFSGSSSLAQQSAPKLQSKGIPNKKRGWNLRVLSGGRGRLWTVGDVNNQAPLQRNARLTALGELTRQDGMRHPPLAVDFVHYEASQCGTRKQAIEGAE
jgi:hypothetical protein